MERWESLCALLTHRQSRELAVTWGTRRGGDGERPALSLVGMLAFLPLTLYALFLPPELMDFYC